MLEEAHPLPVPAHVAPRPAQTARASSGRLRRRCAVELASELQSHAPKHQNEQQAPGTRVVQASHFILPRQSRVNPTTDTHTQAGRQSPLLRPSPCRVLFRSVLWKFVECSHMGQEPSSFDHHHLVNCSQPHVFAFLSLFFLTFPLHPISRSHHPYSVVPRFHVLMFFFSREVSPSAAVRLSPIDCGPRRANVCCSCETNKFFPLLSSLPAALCLLFYFYFLRLAECIYWWC
jgi:hypothetical protein